MRREKRLLLYHVVFCAIFGTARRRTRRRTTASLLAESVGAASPRPHGLSRLLSSMTDGSFKRGSAMFPAPPGARLTLEGRLE
jgi:hypothetical protein